MLGALAAAGCDGANPMGPSRTAVVTFRVSDEAFRVLSTDSHQIDLAR
jgi:hypothetical protein